MDPPASPPDAESAGGAGGTEMAINVRVGTDNHVVHVDKDATGVELREQVRLPPKSPQRCRG